jgi:hypothetical protein
MARDSRHGIFLVGVPQHFGNCFVEILYINSFFGVVILVYLLKGLIILFVLLENY